MVLMRKWVIYQICFYRAFFCANGHTIVRHFYMSQEFFQMPPIKRYEFIRKVSQSNKFALTQAILDFCHNPANVPTDNSEILWAYFP
jgi:hypothetical protein